MLVRKEWSNSASSTSSGELISNTTGAGITAITVDGEGGSAEVVVRNGASDGAVKWNMSAPSNDSRSISFPYPLKCDKGIWVSVSGPGRVSIAYLTP